MEDREQRLQDFKSFLLKKPHVIQTVRKGESTWQEIFEEWYLFGEDDKHWKGDESDSSSSSTSMQWFNTVKNKIQALDDSQIEEYVDQCKDALDMLSELLSQFQSPQTGETNETKNESYMTYWK
ncbi:spore coat protein YlbD [Jeotgalibacillus marinus]|uniref:Spore coat protein YlbD n=1 Tax=Jeotgalibacillus marinus TaxID=86667 RepID=A0ABV3Q256_9BACL